MKNPAESLEMLGGDSDDSEEAWCRPVLLPGGRVKRLVMPGEPVRRGFSENSEAHDNVEPWSCRYFTPRELLQIAGFPCSFCFPSTITPRQRDLDEAKPLRPQATCVVFAGPPVAERQNGPAVVPCVLRP